MGGGRAVRRVHGEAKLDLTRSEEGGPTFAAPLEPDLACLPGYAGAAARSRLGAVSSKIQHACTFLFILFVASSFIPRLEKRGEITRDAMSKINAKCGSHECTTRPCWKLILGTGDFFFPLVIFDEVLRS